MAFRETHYCHENKILLYYSLFSMSYLKTAFFLTSVKFPPVCFIKCSKLHSLPSSRQHQDRNSHWQKQLVQNQAHSSSTSRENKAAPGLWGSNDTQCYFFHKNSLELFKDGSPRKQDFNPIYFFRVLKRSLINLHVPLTKCPNSTSCALESHGGRNNSQGNLSSEKLASKGTWRLKKRDSEPLGQHMKNPRGCPVYLLFDQLNERGSS